MRRPIRLALPSPTLPYCLWVPRWLQKVQKLRDTCSCFPGRHVQNVSAMPCWLEPVDGPRAPKERGGRELHCAHCDPTEGREEARAPP